jgi:HK97 family phage major capsid protein
MEIINFSADLEASESRRIIAGKIVPFGNEIGNTSVGKVIFEQNSIQINEPKNVKLLLEHDPKKPIGRMKNVTEDSSGIFAEFKVSNTTRGTDSLIEASENLRNGLSVGVEVIKGKNVNGIYRVSAARLMEVSLVNAAAFESASVTSVAASNAEAESTETKTENEEIVENTTPETPVATEVVETPAVEASRPTVTAAVYTKPRLAPMSSAQYLGTTIKAAMGDDDARQTILAADDSTSTNTGLTLPSHLTDFVTTTFQGRPAVDAVTRAGVVPQLTFTIPKLGTAPTVASTAEGVAPSETGMTSTYDTISAVKYSGYNEVSFELLDFSNPAFEGLLLEQLRRAYAKATDNAMIAAFTASGVQATGVAATAAGLQSFIATESAAAYKGTGGNYAKNLVASTDQWAAIMGYADSTGRGLYIANNPMNNSGDVSGQSVTGQILGSNLFVDHNISVSGIVDESAFLVAPESVYVWESPATQLRVNILTSGQVGINLYGYMAIAVLKGGAGVRRYNLA